MTTDVLEWDGVSRRRRRGLIAAVAAAFATAVTGVVIHVVTSAPCHLRGAGPTALPDPRCTSLTTNPDVTPATIRSTICRPGWATSVRPPVSVTNRIKAERIRAYGLDGVMAAHDIELDHLVPISLGGGLADVAGLWPQPEAAPNLKDDVERAANAAVCRKGRDLRLTQRQMAGDWLALGRALGVKGIPAGRAA